MKLATALIDGASRICLVDPAQDRLWPLDLGVASMMALIPAYDSLKDRIVADGPGLPLGQAQLLAPLPRPGRNIMCVGKNYRDHAHEFARSGFDGSAGPTGDGAVPTDPIIFTKAPETVVATGEPVLIPRMLSDQIDYEAELAVIIGRGGKAIARGNALDHVWGYTIVNDVTARDLQQRHKQWFLGKSLDTFCPMGPWVVTADEISTNPLDVKCWVNGELRQDASTADLIFDVPSLISTISAGLTLRPGDVIATGTPAGVGIGFKPPKFLKPGDEVAIEISSIGRLVNRFV